MDDDNSLIAERRAKLAAIRARGIAFPNDFKPRDRAGEPSEREATLKCLLGFTLVCGCLAEGRWRSHSRALR